jgi:WD40 repeat protein
LEDQVGLVFKLKNRLEEDHFQQEADELRELLLRLRQRDDLLAKVAKDLDLVMASINESLSPLALDRGGKPPQISIRPAVEETKETEKRTEFVHTKGVHSVAFSPDGTLLASGQGGFFGFDSVVRLWRVSDGTSLRTLEGYLGTVNSVAFSPDGSMLASGADDKTVRLWRVSDGTSLRTLEGHSREVTSVAFSPDGSMLASGANDKTVRLWRVSDGTFLRTLEGHSREVTSVAFSPDGSMLASGSGDKTVRLWQLK